MCKGVLCDTNFFIHLLAEKSHRGEKALFVFEFLKENGFEVFISSIAIAEFCLKSNFQELPLKYLTVLHFTSNHAQKTACFGNLILEHRKVKKQLPLQNLIIDDTKMFAQADCEPNIKYFLTFDLESKKIYDVIKPNFQFVGIDSNFEISDFFLII